jgi:hypothetical protein
VSGIGFVHKYSSLGSVSFSKVSFRQDVGCQFSCNELQITRSQY